MVTSQSLQVGGLSLKPFVTYHANVMAYTFSALHALESSDGINVDNSKPAVGIVFDGLGKRSFIHFLIM